MPAQGRRTRILRPPQKSPAAAFSLPGQQGRVVPSSARAIAGLTGGNRVNGGLSGVLARRGDRCRWPLAGATRAVHVRVAGPWGRRWEVAAGLEGMRGGLQTRPYGFWVGCLRGWTGWGLLDSGPGPGTGWRSFGGMRGVINMDGQDERDGVFWIPAFAGMTREGRNDGVRPELAMALGATNGDESGRTPFDRLRGGSLRGRGGGHAASAATGLSGFRLSPE